MTFNYFAVGPILVTIFIIGLAAAYILQDRFRAWTLGVPLGPFKFFFVQRTTTGVRERKANVTGLTEVIADMGAGPQLIEALTLSVKHPAFKVPGVEAQEFLGLLKKTNPATLFTNDGFRLFVFGNRSLMHGRELMVAYMEGMSEEKALSHYSFHSVKTVLTLEGRMTRTMIFGRQFYLPRKISIKRLGRRLRIFVFYPVDMKGEDNKSYDKLMQAMEKHSNLVASFIPVMSETRLYHTELKNANKTIGDLTRTVTELKADSSKSIALTMAARESSNFRRWIVGLGTRPVRGAFAATVMVAAPTIGAILLQYGFNSSPVFGALFGSVIAVLIVSSRT